MRTIFLKGIMVLAMVIAFTACASAPPPEPEVISRPGAPEALLASRQTAEDYRAKALEAKANVASRELWNPGEESYNQGTSHQDSESWDEALASFDTAGSSFKAAWESAVAKREAALKSMEEAEAERIASENALKEAEAAEAEGSDEGGQE